MGSFRQGTAHANVQTPLLIVAGLLLLVALLAMFQQQLRRRRRTRYHPALELEAKGVVGQIQRRKEDLNRFIAKLRNQLAVREEQLRVHDELEELVTARVETSRQENKEWREIMRAGRKVHGKQWNAAMDGDGPSLKELMELHKDELLEFKANLQGKEKRDRRSRRAQVMQLPLNHPSLCPVSSSPAEKADVVTPRVIPPQWQSTRRVAGTVSGAPALAAANSSPVKTAPPDGNNDHNLWSKQAFATPAVPIVEVAGPVIPRLDLSRLGGAFPPRRMDHEGHSPPVKKTFAQTFERQGKLATMLKKKH